MNRALLPGPLTVRTRRTATCQHRAFTLVELMVVILIIGILSGIVIFNTQGAGEDAKVVKAQADVRALGEAVDMFWMQAARHGYEQSLPRTLQELVTGPAEADGNWSSLLRSNAVPQDPWGREYRYTCDPESGSFEVRCLGRDGRHGGTPPYDEDIVYPLTVEEGTR